MAPEREAAGIGEAPPNRLARLARNALANLLRLGTSWLIVLLVPPALVRHLDKPAYATWMLVLQLGAYATLFDGGLQLAVGRFVARAEQGGDRRQLGEILSSATALLTGAAALVLLLVVAASFSLGRVFHSIPAALLPQAAAALLLVGGALALAFPSSVLAGLTLGRERNQVNAVAGGVSKLAGAAGSVWAAVHGQGLVAMAAWTAGGTLLQPAIFALASRREGLRTLLRFSLVRMEAVREFARFCSAMVASQLGMLLISGLDLPIVAAYNFSNAAYYALATTVSNMLVAPHIAVISTLVPMAAGMSGAEHAERLGRVLLRVTRLSTAMLALITVPLMLGMPLLLRLWVGAEYARHTLWFAELLVFAQLVRLTLLPYALLGFGAGEQSRMLVSPTVESIVNLGCSLLLVRYLGAAGVAWGTLAGSVVGVALHFGNSMPRTRSLVFARRKLLVGGILVPAAWALPGALLLGAGLAITPGLAPKLLVLTAGAALLALLFWKVVFLPADRAAFASLRSRFLPDRGPLQRSAS